MLTSSPRDLIQEKRIGCKKTAFSVSPSHIQMHWTNTEDMFRHVVKRGQHGTILLGILQQKRSILNNGQPFNKKQ